MDMKWQPIETAPPGRHLLWCPDTVGSSVKPHGVVFGNVKHWNDGVVTVNGDGMNGNWTFSHWMPLPPAPGATRTIPDSDAVCTTCRWKGGHDPNCARADEPWPTIEVAA